MFRTPGVWDGSIVDPNLFGNNYMRDGEFPDSFDIGPLVGDLRQRVYFYNHTGALPYVCRPHINRTTTPPRFDPCGICQNQEDGKYCGSNSKMVCSGQSCKACGGMAEPCCVGRTCSLGGLRCNDSNFCVPI